MLLISSPTFALGADQFNLGEQSGNTRGKTLNFLFRERDFLPAFGEAARDLLPQGTKERSPTALQGASRSQISWQLQKSRLRKH